MCPCLLYLQLSERIQRINSLPLKLAVGALLKPEHNLVYWIFLLLADPHIELVPTWQVIFTLNYHVAVSWVLDVLGRVQSLVGFASEFLIVHRNVALDDLQTTVLELASFTQLSCDLHRASE